MKIKQSSKRNEGFVCKSGGVFHLLPVENLVNDYIKRNLKSGLEDE